MQPPNEQPNTPPSSNIIQPSSAPASGTAPEQPENHNKPPVRLWHFAAFILVLLLLTGMLFPGAIGVSALAILPFGLIAIGKFIKDVYRATKNRNPVIHVFSMLAGIGLGMVMFWFVLFAYLFISLSGVVPGTEEVHS